MNYIYKTYEDVDKSIVHKADIIIGNPPTEMLIDSPNLKWLQLNTAGTDAYIKEGILLTSSQKIFIKLTRMTNF